VLQIFTDVVEGSLRGVTGVLRVCYGCVTEVLQELRTNLSNGYDVTGMFQVTVMMLQGCSK
jgi:hypothetical protein